MGKRLILCLGSLLHRAADLYELDVKHCFGDRNLL